MKFLSTATTAALTGLLLLVSAAYGDRHYTCVHGRIVSEKEVLEEAGMAYDTVPYHDHPPTPTGETYKSILFSRFLNDNQQYIASYLVQVYGSPQKIQLSVFSEKKWKICSFVES
ncbi:BgTH12-04696 [Blumeria graminis f. sp. triticale]|uniref:Bgt-51122 n=2 Tax=Blumeria graminis TaxID=34373 RepID=A0A9X9L7F6_BLUGR|nr:BgTH12-04696 [Blumeria graminis f. sp. triticale]VCU39180.1 Bgt-51122 [Blumeria graminis f. sp. tritici]